MLSVCLLSLLFAEVKLHLPVKHGLHVCAKHYCDPVMGAIMARAAPNPGQCAACHLVADISIVLVTDNDSYYAASMTSNDSHSPRYQ